MRDLFNNRDAFLILSIPLSSSRLDTWFWAFESSGQFSVKSTYRYLQLGKDGGAHIFRSAFGKNSGNSVSLLRLKICYGGHPQIAFPLKHS